jgi:hypothetical protein
LVRSHGVRRARNVRNPIFSPILNKNEGDSGCDFSIHGNAVDVDRFSSQGRKSLPPKIIITYGAKDCGLSSRPRASDRLVCAFAPAKNGETRTGDSFAGFGRATEMSDKISVN